MSDAAALVEFDIVNRLRKFAASSGTYDVRDDSVRVNVGLLQEAAKEIERLRTAIPATQGIPSH